MTTGRLVSGSRPRPDCTARVPRSKGPAWAGTRVITLRGEPL